MGSPNEVALLVILLLEATTGLLSGLFIIVCLSAKVFQRTNMRSYSQLMIPLNVSIMCYNFLLSINYIISLLCPELLRMASFFCVSMYMMLYSITSSLWLAAGLCVFYFIKILPSQPGVLTTLKSRIGAIVWWLIFTAEVVSLGGSFLLILIYNPQQNQMNSSLTEDLKEDRSAQKMNFTSIVLVLNWLPFLIIMATTIGSVRFLKLYNHQIEKNMATSGNTSVRDYGAVIKTMTGLLVLFTFVFLCMIILSLDVVSYLTSGYWLCVMFIFSFSGLLSALFIYGNPKLKEVFKQIFTL
ncbi:taste receptor type 2 member 40-like [Rhinoderma darwinii]|uniref:taste receptor type 2 member 40-like n=1 Tax=Rhinoderma darwinii TaxID=43563 RepID=UPI003F6797B9